VDQGEAQVTRVSLTAVIDQLPALGMMVIVVIVLSAVLYVSNRISISLIDSTKSQSRAPHLLQHPYKVEHRNRTDLHRRLQKHRGSCRVKTRSSAELQYPRLLQKMPFATISLEDDAQALMP
jgi:hypothetical protein